MPLPTEEEFRAKDDLKEIKTAHEEECPICNIPVEKPSGLYCDCAYVYCYGCLWEWLSGAGRGKCPTCRRKFFRLPGDPATVWELWESHQDEWMRRGGWPLSAYDFLEFADFVTANTAMAGYTRLDEGLLETEDRATFRVDLISDILTYRLNYEIDFAVVEGIVLPDSTIEDWKLVVSTLIQFCQLLEGETLPVREVTSKLLEALRMSSWNAGPALKAFLAKSDEQIIREHDDAQYCEELDGPSDAKIAHFPFAVTGLAWRVTLWENSKKRIATGRSPESAATEEQGEQAPGGN